MAKPAIEVERISKRYQLGVLGSTTLREVFEGFLKRCGGQASREADPEEIWVLQEISFEVQEGEVLGIVGKNGAGKSTLLKILSRITAPTSGRAVLRGRVASLLEVGTGFHPDLTGRENIYLNGAILGMRRWEINRKFREIVAFAEVEKFVDTPVKHYSSGMLMRLAFAVAAHLESEILILDEVLAVGDFAFQKKCLGKMNDVAKQGRTVLFVSHQMGAVAALCDRAAMLRGGRIALYGPAAEVVNRYISSEEQSLAEQLWEDFETAPGSDAVRMRAVRIVSEGRTQRDVRIDREVVIEMEFWNRKPGSFLAPALHLMDKTHVGVLSSGNLASACLKPDTWTGRPYPEGLYKARCRIPANFLNEGRYWVNALVFQDHQRIAVRVDDAVCFDVLETGEMRKEYMGHWLGVVRPRLEWHTEMLP